MRRHAKASTAGSTQRQATGLGRLFRGTDAARGVRGESKGSSALAGRRPALLLAFLIAVFCVALGAGVASALAPTIASTSVSGVTTKTAVLEAEINPEGEATTYHFEYGLADCSSNPCTSDPIPDGNVGAGSTAVKISREVKGLEPGTTYHFRVVATNGSGPTASADRSFTTYAVPGANTSCPNQEFRSGPSATLPDCRAYEMVTPVDKEGGDIVSAVSTGGAQTLTGFDQGSALGGKISYSSYRAFGGSLSAPYTSQYIAARGSEGWTTHSINAPRGTSTPSFIPLPTTEFKAYSPDLSTALMFHNAIDPLTPDAVPGYANLFKRDNLTTDYTALTTVQPTVIPTAFFPEIQGASSDGRHVIFRVADKLTPDAPVPGGNDTVLYEWFEGSLRFVGVLPNGEPAPGSTTAGTANNQLAYGSLQSVDNAISDDGSRIFWTSGPFTGPGQIYVRINGQSTVAVSGSVSAENARFWKASGDGSTVIFSIGTDLYEFDVDTETPTLIASQVPGVLGASDDISHVYFVSQEVLAAGATAGLPNVYLSDGGTFAFVGTITNADASTNQNAATPIAVRPVKHLAQVTPDGRHLAFVSAATLTGYDNSDTVKGTPDPEVYLYDADSGGLTCASCNPSGARPTGGTFLVGSNGGVNGAYFAAAIIPSWRTHLYQARALSEDGNRLFFESYDALVPQDTNGVRDVYQWEAQGSGDCAKASGCVDLLSTGKSTANSEFVDATPDGEEVFIRTQSSIDPRDPGLLDIYVAKAGGGFPYTPPVEGCVGDACQSPPAAPNDPTPASASFKGAGNPAPRKARRNCRVSTRKGKGAQKAKKSKQTKRKKRCTRKNRRAGR